MLRRRSIILLISTIISAHCSYTNAQDYAIDTTLKHNEASNLTLSTSIDTAHLSLGSIDTATYAYASKAERIKLRRNPDPTRSVWLGLVLPGLGQIYNQRYWKLPIIYGGFAGCIYAIQWNNKYYQDYLAGYKDIMDADPNTQSYLKLLPHGTDPNSTYARNYLNQKQNYYRKYRDLSIIITVGVYALSVVDAFVDAQLRDFDISPDVSMKVAPTFIENPQSNSLAQSSVGMRVKLNF